MPQVPGNARARRSGLVLIAALLAACSAPAPRDSAAPLPSRLPAAGLVVGSVSYPAGVPQAPARVRFERLHTETASAAYSLVVQPDPATGHGSFAGFLPEGIYRFRLAESDRQRFVPTSLQLPFEVNPGEVRDAGQYALLPATDLGLGLGQQPIVLRTGISHRSD